MLSREALVVSLGSMLEWASARLAAEIMRVRIPSTPRSRTQELSGDDGLSYDSRIGWRADGGDACSHLRERSGLANSRKDHRPRDVGARSAFRKDDSKRPGSTGEAA